MPLDRRPAVAVTVVICAYTVDRWDQLCAAVESVLGQDPSPAQLVVVIDHCARLERLALDAFTSRGVEVVASSGKPGLSGARNTGTARATGEVVAFLDDDAVAQPGWVGAHSRHYADAHVLGVGGHVVPRWETGAPRWFPPEFGWVVGCSYVGLPARVSDVRNPIGANMSFRRTVIERTGGFASSLGRTGAGADGCEETELSIRAAQLFPGGRILHVPEAAVSHHVTAARGTWRYFRRRCWAEGRSKARMSRLVDPGHALASERAYVRRVLPEGVRRNVTQALRRREVHALLRAGAICGGLAITSAGFAATQFSSARAARA